MRDLGAKEAAMAGEVKGEVKAAVVREVAKAEGG